MCNDTLSSPGGVTFNPSSIVNTTSVCIQNGNLYYATQKGGGDSLTSQIFAFTGLPTTGSETATAIITAAAGDDSGGFAGFAISPNGSTAYVAYAGTNSTAGVQKYTYSGGVWSHAYDLATSINDIKDLAVNFATGTIYAVDPTNLYQIVDTGGSSSTATSLASVGTALTMLSAALSGPLPHWPATPTEMVQPTGPTSPRSCRIITRPACIGLMATSTLTAPSTAPT